MSRAIDFVRITGKQAGTLAVIAGKVFGQSLLMSMHIETTEYENVIRVVAQDTDQRGEKLGGVWLVGADGAAVQVG